MNNSESRKLWQKHQRVVMLCCCALHYCALLVSNKLLLPSNGKKIVDHRLKIIFTRHAITISRNCVISRRINGFFFSLKRSIYFVLHEIAKWCRCSFNICESMLSMKVVETEVKWEGKKHISHNCFSGIF